jgi:DNA-binding transcriptional regulator of glucitol operon
VLSKVRRALTPGWLFVHLIAIALVVTMVLLGRWQLIVSDRKHFSLQNFGYAIQWWLFSGFVVALWVRVLRDGLRETATGSDETGTGSQHAEAAQAGPDAVAYRRYVMPQSAHAPVNAEDAHQAAYNEYLSSLAESDKDSGAGRG